ncbi:MAG: transposase [Anaerolineaceae bacterium]|nr:transposase [Anaerolineaceae bacterium]
MPYYRLFYHMVWGTKTRNHLSKLNLKIHCIMSLRPRERFGVLIYAVGDIEDHIHLVATVPLQIALSDFIGQVKGHSSHFVNQKLAIPSHFQWQREYGVVSFGGKQLDQVVKYVKNQRQHHADGTLIPFLSSFQL